MKMVKRILSRFTVVVTCVCIAVPLFNLMVGGVKDDVSEMLLQIIEISLFCSLGEFLSVDSNCVDKYSKKTFYFKLLVYYLYVNISVIGFGCFVGWFDINNRIEIIAIVIMLFLIFAINYLVTYIKDSSDSKKINERLEKMRNDNE